MSAKPHEVALRIRANYARWSHMLCSFVYRKYPDLRDGADDYIQDAICKALEKEANIIAVAKGDIDGCVYGFLRKTVEWSCLNHGRGRILDLRRRGVSSINDDDSKELFNRPQFSVPPVQFNIVLLKQLARKYGRVDLGEYAYERDICENADAFEWYLEKAKP